MDVLKQVNAARTAALVIPSPWLTPLRVEGGDRLAWLNGLVTCDLGPGKVAPGAAAYGLAVAKNGRILADLTIVVLPDALTLVVPTSAAAALRASLEHYLIMEDAAISPAPAPAPAQSPAVYAVHGPLSAEILDAARAAGAIGGAIDPTGLGGAIIVASEDRSAAVFAALDAATTARGGILGDLAGWDALRLECAVPAFGADFDDTTYPQEAGLEKRAVSFSKGCYLGQEVVCMLEMRGHVKRKLVSLIVDAAATPARGAEVTDVAAGRVGEITSSAWSPTLGRPIALAMVKRASADIGGELRVVDAVAKVVVRPV